MTHPDRILDKLQAVGSIRGVLLQDGLNVPLDLLRLRMQLAMQVNVPGLAERRLRQGLQYKGSL